MSKSLLMALAFLAVAVVAHRWQPANSPVFVLRDPGAFDDGLRINVRNLSDNELISLRVRLIARLYDDAATARDSSLPYALVKVQQEMDRRK